MLAVLSIRRPRQLTVHEPRENKNQVALPVPLLAVMKTWTHEYDFRLITPGRGELGELPVEITPHLTHLNARQLLKRPSREWFTSRPGPVPQLTTLEIDATVEFQSQIHDIVTWAPNTENLTLTCNTLPLLTGLRPIAFQLKSLAVSCKFPCNDAVDMAAMRGFLRSLTACRYVKLGVCTEDTGLFLANAPALEHVVLDLHSCAVGYLISALEGIVFERDEKSTRVTEVELQNTALVLQDGYPNVFESMVRVFPLLRVLRMTECRVWADEDESPSPIDHYLARLLIFPHLREIHIGSVDFAKRTASHFQALVAHSPDLRIFTPPGFVMPPIIVAPSTPVTAPVLGL